ncbi:MAG: hypothetical protein ACI31W_03165 [Lactococcus sp.]
MNKKIMAFSLALIMILLSGFTFSAKVKADTNIYRLSSSTGAHLYTSDTNEYMTLDGNGWTGEGVKFETSSTGTPIYRVYNPASGEHLYTKDLNQIRVLTTQQGWTKDNGGNPVFYSNGSIPVYGLYNAKAGIGSHFQTADVNEKNALLKQGWKADGSNAIAWYASGNTVVAPIDYRAVVYNYQSLQINNNNPYYTYFSKVVNTTRVAATTYPSMPFQQYQTVLKYTTFYANLYNEQFNTQTSYINIEGKIMHPPFYAGTQVVPWTIMN